MTTDTSSTTSPAPEHSPAGSVLVIGSSGKTGRRAAATGVWAAEDVRS